MDRNAHPEYVLYLRKSKGRAGIARQRTITTAHVVSLGGVVAAEFADVDRTAFRKVGAGRPEREHFDEMLAWLSGRPGAGIAAWHADRLLRDPGETENLIRVCVAGGHPIETPRGGTYDLSTATGRKRLRSDANDATYEVDHMTERITAAKTEAAQAGLWRGGRRPFGYEAGGMILRPSEAGPLAAGIRAVIAGQSLGSLSREWNAAGILTSSANQWVPRQLGRVLLRARNAGLVEHDGQVVGPALWPGVVTETEWRAVRAVLGDPARRTSPGPERQWLGSGIYLCGVCEHPLICTTTGAKNGRARPVYRCRSVPGSNTGTHVGRDALTLDAYIGGLVVERMRRPDAAAALIPDPPDLALLYAERTAIEAQLDEHAADAGQRRITARQLTVLSEPLIADLEHVNERIAAAAVPSALAPFADGRDPGDVWKGMSLSRRRAAVTALMAPVIHPAPKGRPAGWQAGQPYFHAASVDPGWKSE